jgi:hypothetical protein
MVDYDSIYPTVPTVPTAPQLQTGENFRFHKVNMVLSQLESEHKHYEKVRKKYSRLRSFFHNSPPATTGTLSVILTMSGIGTSLTCPGLIVGIPLSAVGGFLGLISATFGFATKKLTIKVSKHEKTIQLIKSKENSISDLVSKALSNNEIDENEFKLIMDELNNYEKLKSEIRVKQNKEYLKKNVPDSRS